MAEIQPLHAVRYDTRTAGALENLVSPPYDVIDDKIRAELEAKSPFNVIGIDLPIRRLHAHGQTSSDILAVACVEKIDGVEVVRQDTAILQTQRHAAIILTRLDDPRISAFGR